MRDPLPGFLSPAKFTDRRIKESFSHVTATSAYSPHHNAYYIILRGLLTVAARGDNRFVKPVAA